MWPDLIQKAKDGGLDVIQTYVFWNGHEPSPGQVNEKKSIFFVCLLCPNYNCKAEIFIIFFLCFSFFAVLFWGEVWSRAVHQTGATSRPLCSSQNWPLRLCWMEFRVLLTSQNMCCILYIILLPSSSILSSGGPLFVSNGLENLMSCLRCFSVRGVGRD